ncbi:ATP-dependent RecD-like DNA helicase [Anoxybacillus rupiensis]|uniref:ATP-dependent RecD2 DNA helicase n=1 Tax=Anoxybacteroides rupiense TaxID=311460 RepID=A0ABT5W065_9BACL|nr:MULTISPECIES: ATP-dependent RecD-like DNA helicase [Anoxybacillus]MBS2773002.1 ATP-dependent RecD-like DNA helicase [Anoxybacillus rupiensis]MDE8562713.1 ATP-dependent RecD-like DNA helicase [Anoxybacillus rupiensis]QHC04874.1 ATP-dependent RecD-like DNA helicase [Anoxybacillus sp. PDR2]
MQRQESWALGEKSFIKGTHIVTIFHNESNLYSVVRIHVEETNEGYDEQEVVVTGYFPRMNEHDVYVFYGAFKDHPRFGRQYVAEYFRKEMPQTKEGLIYYLSSDLFKGIGKKTAEQIVEALGDQAISVILADPEALAKVPKLPKNKAKELYETLKEHQGLEQIMIALSQFGFGPQLSMKIYQVYKEAALDVIQKNPYQLVEDVEGIGFRRADELGQQLGLSGSHPDRVRAACLYVIESDCLQEGHVYVTKEQLLFKAKQLLESKRGEDIPPDMIERELLDLAKEGKVIHEDGRFYIPTLYFAEKGIITNIKRLLEQKVTGFPEAEFLLALGRLEERLDVQYGPLQKDAIQQAISSPLFILTGGPGTGKTTVIKGIVEIFADLHGVSLDPKDYHKENPFPILLAAPTGRAAKRMSEATGLPAMTIHRLLGYNAAEGFTHHEDEPIEGNLLIVDEMSMVDTWLANQLLKSLPTGMQVILVGDEDQLPSVGPGQVLKDLLKTSRIPTIRLTEVYRQAEGSSIIELAHCMKKGELPADLSSPKTDRSFIRCKAEQVVDVVRQIADNAWKKGYSVKDIQVLAPMYRGPAGIDRLNRTLQELFNPKSPQKRELSSGETVYRVGDKVLQLVNQPDQNVFNGDIGEIVAIFYAKENTEQQDLVVVSFDGNEVTYTRQDLTQITHAYCCSIHKAQGSEFPIVILPVVKSYYRMLQRNLLYTAVTRSKKFLILCGEEEAFRIGTARCDDGVRQTTLAEKIQQLFEPVDEMELPLDDAGIGMENVSPYDFMIEEAK